jgi:hypothetical protein
VVLKISASHVGALSNIVKKVEPDGNVTKQVLFLNVPHTGALANIVNKNDLPSSKQILRLVLTSGGGVTDVCYVG